MKFLESAGTAVFCMAIVFLVLLALWGSIVVFNAILKTLTGKRSQG
jgi:hypothetical protein